MAERSEMPGSEEKLEAARTAVTEVNMVLKDI
jgi:hypothetical protein